MKLVMLAGVAVNPKYVTAVEPFTIDSKMKGAKVWVVGHSGYGTFSVYVDGATVEQVTAKIEAAANTASAGAAAWERVMSRFVEKSIFKILLREAAAEGYEPAYVDQGEGEGVDVAGSSGRALDAVFAVDDAGVTFALIGASPVEYREGKPYYEGFWVKLIGGNGVDFISDYTDREPARSIMAKVYAEIES